mmetsp:Transcript_59955/g.158326  ORF Transcript_59955/g.158326 Transcript_59955/m.158326 type:complete len:252 (-) Transcript_59955:24-779(-)
MRAESEPWLVPMRIARPRSRHTSTSGANASTMYSRSRRKSSSVSYTLLDSSSFRPSAKLPGLIRIFSTASAVLIATFGWKCMSAHSGMSYPFLLSPSRIAWQASASFMPTTVMRTRSKPSSAQRITWSIVPLTSLVDVVPIVWRTIGCSEPKLIGPHVTVRVGRRNTSLRSSQYLPVIGPNLASRAPPFSAGVHRTSSGVHMRVSGSTPIVGARPLLRGRCIDSTARPKPPGASAAHSAQRSIVLRTRSLE